MSFSVPLLVVVALRRGPFAASPQKIVQLKIKTSASVTIKSDPQNSESATSKPAGRVLVGDWVARVEQGCGGADGVVYVLLHDSA